MNSDLHKVLKQTKLIIWDEAPMQHRYGPEALDRTLQDLFENELLFGGITVLFIESLETFVRPCLLFLEAQGVRLSMHLYASPGCGMI
jgi:hypothetical protein